VHLIQLNFLEELLKNEKKLSLIFIFVVVVEHSITHTIATLGSGISQNQPSTVTSF